MSSLFALFCALLFVLSSVAYPTTGSTRPQTLIVWNPKITSPSVNGQPWNASETRNVTWLTDDMPEEKKNSTGIVMLGHWKAGSKSENLDYMHPIAANFSLAAGWVPCTLPFNVTPGHDYFVTLFGDSGNISPVFEIRNAASH